MTSVPVNARSEFVMPAKPSGGGVCDTMRRFQIASPASCRPPLRPTRVSGDGGRTSGRDMSGPDDVAAPACVAPGVDILAQAAILTAAGRIQRKFFIVGNREGGMGNRNGAAG